MVWVTMLMLFHLWLVIHLLRLLHPFHIQIWLVDQADRMFLRMFQPMW